MKIADQIRACDDDALATVLAAIVAATLKILLGENIAQEMYSHAKDCLLEFLRKDTSEL